MNNDLVLYVYECAEGGHDGSVHLAGDTHDGETAKRKFCGAEVSLGRRCDVRRRTAADELKRKNENHQHVRVCSSRSG